MRTARGKTLGVLVIISLLNVTPVTADWQPTMEPNGTYFIFDEEAGFKSAHIFAAAFDGGARSCLEVETCLGTYGSASVETWLAPCQSEVETNCVANFKLIDVGQETPITYSLSQLNGPEVARAPEFGLNGSKGPTLASGPENFLISARVSYSSNGGSFKSNGFYLTVKPVEHLYGGYSDYEIKEVVLPDRTSLTESAGGPNPCVWQVEGSCWRGLDQSTEDVYSLTLRLGNEWTGYLRARIHELDVVTRPLTNGEEVTITGKPQAVQKLFWETYPEEWSEEILEAWCGAGSHPCDRPSGGLIGTVPTGPRAFELLEAFRIEAMDKSATSVGEWSMRLVPKMHLACSNQFQGFLGYVSTNAPVIEDSFPAFENGYLSYKVAGLHYAPDGETVNEGTYDLVMRSDVARCLYGFKNAPVSATVAVVGENGEEKVATTIVSEKDGWLKLAAYGFTFSENEIRAQIRQSQIKTLTNFTSSYLSAKQKAEIRAVLAKSDGNTKFICTGIRYYQQPMRENIKVRARAKAACDYAKSINPNFSYWYQTKTTQARSYNGKVMVVSKG